jgi:hypothetical protein
MSRASAEAIGPAARPTVRAGRDPALAERGEP